jgi:serine/threonine protein kinase
MPGTGVKSCPECGAQFDPAAEFCQLDGVRLVVPSDKEDPYLGTVLLDQFRIEEVLGAGGMGTVYRAKQTTVDRDVAIKVLHPELVKNPDAVRRFQREAKVSSSLEHPNVVRVFLFGQLPDGSLYIVMQYLDGRPLSTVIRDDGALSLSRALHIACQICDGVGDAHNHRVVHRDVKPENVFLVERGGDPDFVKVLDFGVARFAEGEQTVATQSGLIFGTARYISPEGAAGETTDARSDVYSIAVLTYQLLCGETPFDSKSPVSLLMKHIHDPAPDLRKRRNGSHVPSRVADLVMRSLSKNPELRPGDANELASALREAADAEGIGLTASRPSLAIRSVSSTLTPLPIGIGGKAIGSSAPKPPRGLHDADTVDNVATSYTMTGLETVPGLPKRSRTGALGTVLVAFVLGAVAVVGGVWLVHLTTERSVGALEDLEHRARGALASGRFDSPPGDNVADLTARMLREEPGHEAALAIRLDAARRLREEALTAREQGFPDEARTLLTRSLALDPENPAAIRVLAEIDARAVHTPGTTEVRIVPEDVQVGDSVTLIAMLAEPPARRGASADVQAPRLSIESNGRRVRDLDVIPGADPQMFIASYTFRRSGSYAVRLEHGETSMVRSIEVRSRGQAEEEAAVTQVPAERNNTASPAVSSESDGIDWRLPGQGGPAPDPITSRPAPEEEVPSPPQISPVEEAPPGEPPPSEPPPEPPAPWMSGSIL